MAKKNKDKCDETQEVDPHQEIKVIIDDEDEEIPYGLISPQMLEYLERLESRRIYLFGDIEKNVILSVISQIHILEQKSDQEIEIIINSDGGYVVDCFALIDVMNASPCEFKITVLGLAASAACMIASNGTRGKRYAGKNAEFMFHEVMTMSPYQYRQSDIPYMARDFERTQGKFTKMFCENTGRTVQEIQEVFYGLRHDKFMTAMEARKFGIIDHVVGKKKK